MLIAELLPQKNRRRCVQEITGTASEFGDYFLFCLRGIIFFSVSLSSVLLNHLMSASDSSLFLF